MSFLNRPVIAEMSALFYCQAAAPRGRFAGVAWTDEARRVHRAHNKARARRLKLAFIERFRVHGNVTQACLEAGGPTRDTIKTWRDTDPDFAAAMEAAEQEATERLEAEAWRRAVEGTEYIRRAYYRGEVCGEDIKREFSDTLMVTLLRARAPHKYRENIGVDIAQVVKVVAGVDPAEVISVTLTDNAARPQLPPPGA